MNLKEKLDAGWLQVNLIFEVLGRPKEHLIEILNLLIKRLGEGKSTIVLKNKIHEAQPIESQNKDPKQKKATDLYFSFAEVEIITENLAKLIEIIFDYMPSSIEIVSPKDLKMKLSDANALLNDLATRLHHYSMAINTLKAERDLLAKKFSEGEKQRKEN